MINEVELKKKKIGCNYREPKNEMEIIWIIY